MITLILMALTPLALLGILWLRYLAEGNTDQTFRQFCRVFILELRKPVKKPRMARNFVPVVFDTVVSVGIIGVFEWYALWVLPLFWLLSYSYSR